VTIIVHELHFLAREISIIINIYYYKNGAKPVAEPLAFFKSINFLYCYEVMELFFFLSFFSHQRECIRWTILRADWAELRGNTLC
jgi:hypothetical protein